MIWSVLKKNNVPNKGTDRRDDERSSGFMPLALLPGSCWLLLILAAFFCYPLLGWFLTRTGFSDLFYPSSRPLWPSSLWLIVFFRHRMTDCERGSDACLYHHPHPWWRRSPRSFLSPPVSLLLGFPPIFIEWMELDARRSTFEPDSWWFPANNHAE